MWTRKEINDFKESIKKDESDAIIKVSFYILLRNFESAVIDILQEAYT